MRKKGPSLPWDLDEGFGRIARRIQAEVDRCPDDQLQRLAYFIRSMVTQFAGKEVERPRVAPPTGGMAEDPEPKKEGRRMQATLSPSWELSTEHATSSYGQPVLVHRTTGDAYGPGDILSAYPSYGLLPAAAVVRRLAKTATLDEEGRALVERFVSLLPPV